MLVPAVAIWTLVHKAQRNPSTSILLYYFRIGQWRESTIDTTQLNLHRRIQFQEQSPLEVVQKPTNLPTLEIKSF